MKNRNRARRACHVESLMATAEAFVRLLGVMDSLPERFSCKQALVAAGMPPTDVNQESMKLVLSLFSDIRRDPRGAYRWVKGDAAC